MAARPWAGLLRGMPASVLLATAALASGTACIPPDLCLDGLDRAAPAAPAISLQAASTRRGVRVHVCVDRPVVLRLAALRHGRVVRRDTLIVSHCAGRVLPRASRVLADVHDAGGRTSRAVAVVA